MVEKNCQKFRNAFLSLQVINDSESVAAGSLTQCKYLGVCFGIFGYIKGTPLRVMMVTIIVKELPDLNI